MVVLTPILIPKYFNNFAKNDQINAFVDLIKYTKIPELFCKASILARIPHQFFFSQCHFVGFSSPSPSLCILFRAGSNLFHIIFAIFIYFPIFCQPCVGNPSANGFFSDSNIFQSQKWFQSKNKDQEKNVILTQIFQGIIGHEIWIRLKNPRKSRRIQKEQI